jgi:hypothetical protein
MERHVTGKPDRSAERTAERVTASIAAVLVLSLALAAPASAAELQQRTVDAFDRYVKLTEAGIDAELAERQRGFLWVERLPEERRAAAYAELRGGEVVIERLETLDDGKRIECPGGMIHHWIGTVFVPGATLAQTLALVEDYDHHQDYYAPDVARSKILRHAGDDYVIYLRFYKRKVITSVVDTQHEVHYSIVDATRAWSRSRTTRVQQVDDAGKPEERLRPVGQDDGFLWRMNTYWRFEEKDGGTYVECQTVSLTRDTPTGLGWLIGGYVTSVPRESLTFTLATTREAILEARKQGGRKQGVAAARDRDKP